MVSSAYDMYYHIIEEGKKSLKAVIPMSVNQRILALRYLKKQQRNPSFADKLGVKVEIKAKGKTNYPVIWDDNRKD